MTVTIEQLSARIERALSSRHYPGKHDQKSHGTWADGGSRALKPHQIAEKDIATFTAGSVITDVLYHRTSDESARSITDDGLDLSRHVSGWVAGLYTSNTEEEKYGSTSVRMVVNMKNPLTIDVTTQEVWPTIKPFTGGMDSSQYTTRNIREAGYDGYVLENTSGKGSRWVVIIDPDTAKVVV